MAGEKEGEVCQRQLKNRHAQMISIGGVISTGLFLGMVSPFTHGGPSGLLLGYPRYVQESCYLSVNLSPFYLQVVK